MKQLLVLTFVSVWCSVSFAQNRYDIVISEIMADPTPQVGLPAVEYIELRNTTNATINLSGWRIADATSQSGALASFNLMPDSMVVICATGSLAQLSPFGTTLSVTSFPSLDNAGDLLSLKAPNGRTIHAVNYTTDWYQNAVKVDGGWSLEMVDTKNPCGGIDNWKSSVDVKGGTPGKKNSVDAVNADTKAPQISYVFVNSPTQIGLVFNESMDSTSAAVVANYSVVPAPNQMTSVISAVPQAPLFNTVLLNLSSPLVARNVYRFIATNVADCKGNLIGMFNSVLAGLPEDADSLDIVINEVLFNPKPNGFDYVEIYNKSEKIIDLSKIFLANKNTAGAIANVKAFSSTPRLMIPREHYTVSENSSWVANNYTLAQPYYLVQTASLPSFNDDEGNVILLNFQGKVVDALNYKDDWHFKLLDNEEGISLERLSYTAATQNAENWHSASSSSRYGTPTGKNSQLLEGNSIGGTVSVSPKTFSPDNDGRDDVLSIDYNVNQNGFLANVTIFDASGVVVRNLKRNDVLGASGKWTWDGLNNKNEKLPTGIYIIATEVFNAQGKKSLYKNTVVLARRLS